MDIKTMIFNNKLSPIVDSLGVLWYCLSSCSFLLKLQKSLLGKG